MEPIDSPDSPKAKRRSFLKATVSSGVSTTAGASLSIQKLDAGNFTQLPFVVGIIGLGGMGMTHLKTLTSRTDVNVAWLCDPDQKRLSDAMKFAREQSGQSPQACADLRRVLDDQRVEAVWIATPDHWHVPASCLALQAGKHVYVETPCCHNLHEGQLLEEAVAKSGKRLQVGTQSRSGECMREAIKLLRSGAIGQVLVAKAWNSQRRGSIGRQTPSAPPPELDFELWLGPVPPVAYRKNLLHGSWRWFHDFGCGDMGNDGVHDIDVALWGLGVDRFPNRIACLGSKQFFDDDQQFPDTQYSILEFDDSSAPLGKRQCVFEQRIWSPYVQEGYENGAAFYGTEGFMLVGHNVGWKLYGAKNQLKMESQGKPELAGHHQNFLSAIRDDSLHCNADISVGRLSAGVVHLSNIAARVGRVLQYDPIHHSIVGDEEAARMQRREYSPGHWASPSA